MSESKAKPIFTRQLKFPAVVACGYKRVKIPKSGNTFPSLLVAFESDACKSASGKSATEPSTKNAVRFAWRSKRDFLLLARTGVDSQEKILPKAAFKKVVDETVVPWRRTSGDAVEQSALNFAIPDYRSNKEIPNNYTVKMKKSISQLDKFLQSMETRAKESAERQTAWDFFCRDSDTEDLVTLDLSCTEKTFLENNTSLSLPDGNSASTSSSAAALRESSRLGQYFASKENARKVANLALEKICSEYTRLLNPSSLNKMLFVEPSCGHGDIILSLIDAIEKHEELCPHFESLWIIGFDIDPAAIETCRKRKEFQPVCTKRFEGNNHETHICTVGKYTVFLECSSFFETSVKDCARRFDRYMHDSYYKTKYSYSISSDPIPADYALICCLGGPPYTTGQGSGSSMKRDLPEQFVDHCYNEWKADVICFLLPARYREDANISSESSFLATKPPPHESRDSDDAWVRETHELEASTFLFRGTTEVTQPSIIKRFYRSQTSQGDYSDGKGGPLCRAEDVVALQFKN